MTAISQSAGYAVLALGCIAKAGGKPLLVRTIAEKCALPAPYLSKVVNKLARAGLVTTQRGVNGGVSIARDPSVLTLYEVCEALDDPILELRCMLSVAGCSDEHPCPAHRCGTHIREALMGFLKNTTIEDIEEIVPGGPGGRAHAGTEVDVRVRPAWIPVTDHTGETGDGQR